MSGRGRLCTASAAVCAALSFAACAASPHRDGDAEYEHTLAAIALADPLFGGGACFEQRLFGSLRPGAQGDPVARAAFVRQMRERADADAQELARELVSRELAAAIAPFLGSPAGNARWSAEQLALALHPAPADDFEAKATAIWSDPERVGLAVTARIREILTDVDERSSPPPELAIELGGGRLRPDDARAIAAFAAIAPGAAWSAVRRTALQRTQQRLQAVVDEAKARGFLGDAGRGPSLLDAKLPTVLPGSGPEWEGPPVFTFVLDEQGRVRCDGVSWPDLGRTTELRAALQELRRQGLAQGRLSTRDQVANGETVSCVDQPVLVRAEKGTPWAHVEALFRLLSEPGIAFWRVELDADPAIVPATMRDPGAVGR